MKNTECSNHPGIPKKTDCSACGNSICDDCITVIADKVYCKSCGYGIINEVEVLYLKKIYNTIKEKRVDLLKDKRKHRRIHTAKAVDIYDEQKEKNIKGVIIDISMGDLSIISDEQISLKSKVKLKFSLGDSFDFENIDGGVLREEKVGDKYYTAVVFMNLAENREKIEDFIMGRVKKKFIREGIGYV